jgi:hypothetical protein
MFKNKVEALSSGLLRVHLSGTQCRVVFDSDKDLLVSDHWQDSKGYAMSCFRVPGDSRLHWSGLHQEIVNPWPRMQGAVDHYNRNAYDDRRSNLRLVSITVNQINRGSSSPIAGVSRSQKSWIASYIDEDRKPHNRSFSIKKYGEAQAKQMAIDVRKHAESLVSFYKQAQTPPAGWTAETHMLHPMYFDARCPLNDCAAPISYIRFDAEAF